MVLGDAAADYIAEYLRGMLSGLVVVNGGSYAWPTIAERELYQRRLLAALSNQNPLHSHLEPAVFSYGWLELLSPVLVERLGGLSSVKENAPVYRVHEIGTADGVALLLQATATTGELRGGVLREWRDYLSPLFPPLGPRWLGGRDVGPPLWITDPEIELWETWVGEDPSAGG